MKEETLEEAMERLSNIVGVGGISDKHAFILGTFWQQERSYSEEDMKSFGDWCRNGLLNTEYSVDRLDKHLEQWKQFKKK